MSALRTVMINGTKCQMTDEAATAVHNYLSNHLAVVAAARGGPDLTIGDDDTIDNGGMTMAMRTILVDNIEVQMDDSVAILVQKTLRDLQTARDQFKKKSEESEAEAEEKSEEAEENGKAADAAKKDADSMREQIKAKDAEIIALKQQVSDATLTPDAIDALVKDRAEVIMKAGAILGDKLVHQNRSTQDIKKQVVDSRLGDKAKKFGDSEVNAAFLSFTDNLAVTPRGVGDAALAFSKPHMVQQDARDTAYADYDKEASQSWRNLGKTA